EERHVDCLRFSRFPVTRVLAGDGNLDWRNCLATNERIEVQQPFLTEESDIQIDAIERAERANRIRTVFEYARQVYRALRNKKLRQWIAGRHVVVQLFVADAAWSKCLFPKTFCFLETWSEAVDRIHCARVVDVVCGD